MRHAVTLSLLVVVALGGCAGEPGEPVTPEEGAITATNAAEALSVTARVAASLSGLAFDPPAPAEGLGGDAGEAGEPAPAGGDATIGGGDAIAPACSTVRWDPRDPLRLTITYDECTMPNGEVLDGTVSVWLSYDGVALSTGLDLDHLRAGDATVDGFLVITAAGSALRLSADVDVQNSATMNRVVLNGATLTVTAGAVQVDGSGSLTSEGTTYQGNAAALVWDGQGCYPSSGTLTLTAPGLPSIAATFAYDAAGPYAMVSFAGLPPFEHRLACPSE